MIGKLVTWWKSPQSKLTIGLCSALMGLQAVTGYLTEAQEAAAAAEERATDAAARADAAISARYAAENTLAAVQARIVQARAEFAAVVQAAPVPEQITPATAADALPAPSPE